MNPRCKNCPVLCHPVLAALPEKLQQEAECLFRGIALRPNTHLYHEGFPAHSIFAVCSGTLKASKVTMDGKERVLAVYGPGDLVALDNLTAETYDHSVQATTDAFICHSPRVRFLDFVGNSQQLAKTVIAHLCTELRSMREEVFNHSTQDGLQRVSSMLSRLADDLHTKDGESFEFPLSRRDTAAMLGMAEESLSRHLGRLEDMGMLTRDAQRLKILDHGKFRQLADR